jgi:hypothetical protein
MLWADSDGRGLTTPSRLPYQWAYDILRVYCLYTHWVKPYVQLHCSADLTQLEYLLMWSLMCMVLPA